MADQKVSDLPSLNGADVDPADLLYIIDSSAGSAGSKKITVGQYQLAPVSGGTANTVVYLNGSKVESSSAALTFDGSNLGVGTSSPGEKLAINQGNIYAIRTGGAKLRLADQNNEVSVESSPTGVVSNMIFKTAAATQMTLDSSGNLGIGTSSPGAKLNLVGDATFQAASASNNFVFRGAASSPMNMVLQADQGSGTAYWITAKTNSTLHIGGNGGSEPATGALVVDASGNLGIGTSAPSAKLHVAGAFRQNDATSTYGYTVTTASSKTVTAALFGGGYFAWQTNASGTDQLTLDVSGNLGLGVTPSAWTGSGGKNIEVGATGNALFGSASLTAYTSNANFDSSWKYSRTGFASRYEQQDSNHRWFTAPSGTAGNTISFTQAMTLTAAGDLLVGTIGNANNYKTHILTTGAGAAIGIFQNNATTPYGINVYYGSASPNNSNANTSFLYCNDLTTLRIQLASNGGIINYQANNSNLSDRREKTDFAPAKSYLDTICAIPVQTFKYIDQTDDAPTLGVVAQDVQAVAPELVMESNWGTEDNPKMRLSIYETDLQYALMKCIQEQQALITDLRARVAALEAA